jgi:4,5-dihydroxyphthalate decarboxylase
MSSNYPRSGRVTLRTNLADSALAAALKSGQVSSPRVAFDFCGPKVAHDGFKPMVHEGAFDAGELAIVTFLQAKTYGKPLTLLPAAGSDASSTRRRWVDRCTRPDAGRPW